MPKFLTFFHIFTCRFTFFYKSFNYLLCVFGDIRKISAKTQIFSLKKRRSDALPQTTVFDLFCRSPQQRHFSQLHLSFGACADFSKRFSTKISLFHKNILTFLTKCDTIITR